jgi:hypothetical protein
MASRRRSLNCVSRLERGLGGNRRCVGLLLSGRAGECGAGSAQHIKSKVAAAFDPFVVLFGQHGADEANDSRAVREDSDDVGAAADLLIETFLRIVGLMRVIVSSAAVTTHSIVAYSTSSRVRNGPARNGLRRPSPEPCSLTQSSKSLLFL